MPVANCTDESVSYTVGNGAGDTDLKAFSFKDDSRIGPNRWVMFFNGTTLLEKIYLSEDLSKDLGERDSVVAPNNSNVIVTLRNINKEYVVSLLVLT